MVKPDASGDVLPTNDAEVTMAMNGEHTVENQTKAKNRLAFHPARRVFGSGSVHDLFKETDDVLLAHRMRFEAKVRSVNRQTLGVFVFSLFILVSSTILFMHVAELGLRDALLYVAYTATSTGFGSVSMPKDNAFFLFYLIVFMYLGVFCTMSVAAHVFLFVKMRASVAKENAILSVASPDEPPLSQTLRVWTPFRTAARSVKELHSSSELGKFSIAAGFLMILLFLVPLPMMYFEDWSYPRALYFWTYVMTTVGYGDIVPVTSQGIWYTIFWLPWNVAFVSIYFGTFARYYLMAANWYTEKLYERAWAQVQKSNNSSNQGHRESVSRMSARAVLSIVQDRFRRPIIVDEGLNDDEQDKSDEEQEDPAPNPIMVLQSDDKSKLSLASFSLASSRLALLIGYHMAGISFDFTLRGNDAYVKIPRLQECMIEWFIPSAARPFLALVAYEVLLLVGQRKLSINGPRIILQMPAEKLYEILAPVIAAFGNTDTIHAWLAWTVTLETQTEYDMVLWPVVLDHSMELRSMELSEIEQTEIADVADLEQLAAQFADITAKVEQNATWYEAKRVSVQRATLWCVFVLLAYEIPITVFIIFFVDTTVAEGLVFTGYTLTSAGFGSVSIPKDDGFLGFAVVNVFISTMLLAAVVAQVHLYLFLRGVMLKQHNDVVDLTRKGIGFLEAEQEKLNKNSPREYYILELNSILLRSLYHKTSSKAGILVSVFLYFDATDFRRNLGAVLIMLTMLLVGVFATMATEGWSFLEATYFCTFALLTVGHGDLVPTSEAGVWVTVFYIPLNIAFLSLYFVLVSRLFSFIQKTSITRIEKQMKSEMKKDLNVSKLLSNDKEAVQTECSQVQMIASDQKHSSSSNVSNGEKAKRRGRVKQISMSKLSFNGKDVSTAEELFKMIQGLSDILDIEPDQLSDESKASFDVILAGLKQVLPKDFHDLLAEWPMNWLFTKRLNAIHALCVIVGSELCNYNSAVETHTDTVLRFTIEGLENWRQKWSIPLPAWHLFKELVFESLFYVGEDRLQLEGYHALVELSVVEVLELFSPFVFRFSDVQNLDLWLKQIQEPLEQAKSSTHEPSQHVAARHKRPILDSELLKFFPANTGNAIRSQLVSNID